MKTFLSFCLTLLFLAFPAFAEGQGPLYPLLTGKNVRLESLDVPSLRRVYEVGGYEPVWKLQTAENKRVLRPFFAYMETLIEENGIESQSETVDLFLEKAETVEGDDQLKLDLAITDWVLAIAKEMGGQALPFTDIYPGWAFSGVEEDLPVELGHALYEQRIYDFLPSLAPPSPDYFRLAQALHLYRLMERQPLWQPINTGPDLKLGSKGLRVQQVRERLEAEAYALPLCRSESETQLFDEDLERVVVDYQSRNGLKASGVVDSRTLAAMNRPVDYRIDQLRANMARLRALPRSWPYSYAMVNIADASIKLFRDARTLYYAQVVLGMPSRRTPFIRSEINSVILNPSWNIPISIARYDILPKLRKDPRYLQQKGYRIKGKEDDPFGTQIDWSNMSPRAFNYRLYQKPGKGNALGSIKFDFDNPFSVYLHGTPHLSDFGKDRRHLSSGCVRLKDPEKLAALVLETNTANRSIEKIRAKANALGEFNAAGGSGGEEMIRVKVENPLPLFIVYQTAFFPSEDISVHFRPDVYGYDTALFAKMKKNVKSYSQLLGGQERVVE